MNVEELTKDLEQRLQAITRECSNELEEAEQSYLVIGQIIQQLKKEFLATSLADDSSVHFFKEIKPKFLSQMIYMAEVYRMLANQPYGNKKCVKRYYQNEQRRISQFINDNQSFYLYHKSGRTNRDKEYYGQATQQQTTPENTFIEIDEQFSTYHSTLLSMLLAYERLNGYIENKIRELSSDAQILSARVSDLKWTENKVKLIELGYSIHAMGVCNNGQADVKQIMEGLEVLFNIQLGNYYSVFLKNIRLRKKNVTIFLDELKESLIRRMDDLDEHPQYS